MNNFYDWIFDQEHDLNKEILSTQRGNFSYRDIQQGVEKYVQLFETLGDIKGKRIALIVPSVYDFTSLALAISKLQGITVPLSPLLRHEDLISVLDFVSPHIVFTVTEHNGFQLWETINQWAASNLKETIILENKADMKWNQTIHIGEKNPLEEGQIQIIGCTSGSTGTPKGIVYDVDFVQRVGKGINIGLDIVDNDKLFLLAPATGVFGLAWILSTMQSKTHLVLSENFNFPEIIQLFESHASQKFITTPSLFKAMDLFGKSLGKQVLNQVSLLSVFGELVTKEFLQTYSDFPAKIMSFLGITEFGTVMYTENDIRNDMNWTLLPNIKYKFDSLSEEGIGELIYQSERPFLGYYQRPDLTSEVYKDGWFFSGDLGRTNDDGKIELVGRKKDMIKKGGQQVIPGEIENVLEKHPDVLRVVVVGIPHPVFGEQIIAFVQKNRSDLHRQELYEYCNLRIARYKIPDQIRFIEEFPMVQGKIDKVALRKKATEQE
ncbi:long-chain fatty acid--CoA ligase [Robertmurraya yapensis]|uniref:Long-chain fatty acid--CoA ligase n=1 Tax=Bacillus yapensis TaxID=2492960 RepID=A0A3S0IN75_9BACI|nr:class I adenylate-forming enzyme family protein [Bacillus yapensis]RTR36162.1 long-chain fatty acid--CoA ligase [Bacillus yapensis]TKT05665.1 acyl--CoA ligase [Bacillus yapensis]